MAIRAIDIVFVGRVVTRGLCSFPLTGLPENATIRSATLRAFQDTVEVSSTATASVDADHVLFSTLVQSGSGVVENLSNSDLAFSTDNSLQYKALDVTSAVIDDRVNDRPASQFLFRLSDEGQAGVQSLVVFAGAAGPHPPQLVVEYQVQ
jgi:hypothetical protein